MGHPRQGESVSLDLISSDLSGGAFVVLRDANMQVRTLLPTERFILDMLEAQVASGIAVDVELVAIEAQGPLSDYFFSEGNGTIDADLGSRGIPATLSAESWGPPVGPSPASLDTSNGTVYASTSDAGLPSGDQNFDIGIWFNTTSKPSSFGLLVFLGANTGNEGIYLTVDSNGFVNLGAPGEVSFTYPVDLTDGLDHFIRIDNPNNAVAVELYVDEVAVGSYNNGYNLVLGGGAFIGTIDGVNHNFPGLIGRTTIYGFPLTLLQGASLFAGGTPTQSAIGPIPNSLLASFYPGVGFMEVPSEGISLPPGLIPFAIASGAGTVHLVGSGRIVQDCQQMGRPSWQANLNP